MCTRSTKRLIPIFLFILLPASVFAQYRGTFSTTGGDATSSALSLSFTAGESVTGVVASSTNFRISTGFYTPPPGDDSDFTAPIIGDIAPVTTPAGQDVAIQTDVTDVGTGLQSVTLFYRSGGSATFVETPMTNAGSDSYTASVPGANITSNGGDFFVSAVDNSGNTSRNPATSSTPIFVTVEAPGLESTLRQGQQQSDYRLISVPLDLANKSSSNVLADLGSYDNTKWRFWNLKNNYFDFEGEDQFIELSSGANFAPGDAFFILSADGGTFRTGAATSLSTITAFSKTLHRGWNFLGNPFSFTVPLSSLSLSNAAPVNVQSFAGGWSASSSLQSFQGYIVDAGEDDDVTLTIDPSPGAGKTANKLDDEQASAPQIAWSIQIDAHSEDYFDTDNEIMSSPQASREWDILDRPEPPVFGDFVSVYFPHYEWGHVHKRFQADVRPEPTAGDTWEFEVAAGARRVVTLSFRGLENVPSQYSLQLIDVQTGLAQDIRLRNTYNVALPGNGEAWPFQLLIGESNFIQDQVESQDLFPRKFELDQNYPNPFNPTTSIRYGVSEEAVVSLKVYNLLGQVVATLVDQESRSAGYHVAHWDALADDGSEAASGLYVYQLQISSSQSTDAPTGSQSIITRKMMLIK